MTSLLEPPNRPHDTDDGPYVLEPSIQSGVHLRFKDILEGVYERGERQFVRLNAEKQDLSEMVLTGANLSGAECAGGILEETDLSHTILRDVSFGRVRASRSILDEADCRDATLTRAHFVGACARSVDLRNVHADESVWRNARMEKCNASGASFVRAILTHADLRGATLHEVNFERADLRNADLRGADFRGTSLLGADIRGADLRDASLEGVVWSDVRYDRRTKWPARFEYANIRGLGPGTMLDRASLLGRSMVGYRLMRAQFNHADLRGIRFHWANLRGASLRGADLRGAKLVRCNARYADFRGAKIVNADLSGADLHRAQLEGADVHGSFYSRKTCWPKGFAYRSAGAIGPKSEHSGRSFTHVDWSGRDLYAALLSGIQIRRGLLRWSFFGHADLTDASLERCDAMLANFEGATMRNTNWRLGRLHEANLTRVDARGACFAQADLRMADLRGADLTLCDFTGANLTGAIFDDQTLWDVGFYPESFGAVCVDEADDMGWAGNFRLSDSIA